MEYPPIWLCGEDVASQLHAATAARSGVRREGAHEVDQPSRLANGFRTNDGEVAFGHDVADGAVQDDVGRDPGLSEDGLSFEPKSELPAKGVSLSRRSFEERPLSETLTGLDSVT
jgi:hypothetical protein